MVDPDDIQGTSAEGISSGGTGAGGTGAGSTGAKGTEARRIDPGVPPSGPGCVECAADGGWWVHLRRCARCGHIGCCDSSPSKHATAHFHVSGHPVICSYEPGEDWFYDYTTGETFDGPELAPPTSHPADQPAPGPKGRVPLDWRAQLSG